MAKPSRWSFSQRHGDQIHSTIKSSRIQISDCIHFACLVSAFHLDIKVKEQSIENMARGRLIYEPPRYMTINQAAKQLIEVERNRGEMGIVTLIVSVHSQLHCSRPCQNRIRYPANSMRNSSGACISRLWTTFAFAYHCRQDALFGGGNAQVVRCRRG